ncbi:MAG TPA: sigma-70 family RNA polymerase sigma factor [Baekduia sp.]|nr:sigma-70 family RNA polymerase sigma factor [Baekduia sp.]
MWETVATDEQRLLAALRDRDEAAFMDVVARWRKAMLNVARAHVSTPASAEEVVQDTWLAVLQGIDRFEGRSALRTWVFRILVNHAKTRGVRERRTVPFSSLAREEAEGDEPSVDPSRFLDAGHPQWPHHWNTFDGCGPRAWPEARLLEREALRVLQRAIDALPPAQRAVITLRDVEGFPAEEVCVLLGLSDGNQRVLLHRARSKVRAALEAVLP